MTDRHAPPHAPEGPDRFTRWGEDAAGLLERHWRRILAVVLVTVALGAAWAVQSHRREAAEAAAQEGVAKIADLFPGGGGNIPESVIHDAAERYQALLKDAPKGPARDTAQLFLGEAYEALGQRNQARAAYEALRSAPPVFSGPARMRLAYLALAEGDPQAAGAAFTQVVETSPGLAPQAAFELGRLAEGQGRKEAAVAAYRQVTQAYPNAPQASEAKARLTALGVEPEPAPPAPAPAEAPEAGAPPSAPAEAPPEAPAQTPAEAPAPAGGGTTEGTPAPAPEPPPAPSP